MKAGIPEVQRWEVQMLIPNSISCSDISPSSTSGQPTVCFMFTSGILLESKYKVSKTKFNALPMKYILHSLLW